MSTQSVRLSAFDARHLLRPSRPTRRVIRGGRRARALCARRARHQFALLIEAIAQGYLTKAAAMREWSDATQRATLVVFGNAVYRSPAARSSKLWRLVKGEHEPCCIAVYMATGIDLRLIEGEYFRRRELLKDGPATRAEEWRAKLHEIGWA